MNLAAGTSLQVAENAAARGVSSDWFGGMPFSQGTAINWSEYPETRKYGTNRLQPFASAFTVRNGNDLSHQEHHCRIDTESSKAA